MEAWLGDVLLTMVCDRSCDFNRAKVIGTIGNTLSYLTESAVRTCGLLITHSYRYANFQHVVFFFFQLETLL